MCEACGKSWADDDGGVQPDKPNQIIERILAALADPPSPDQRDEALRLAEEALHMCHSTHDGKYPMDYNKIRDALAAIAAAKGKA